MTSTNETILRRIKKCLALSKSSEPHEAAAALRQAQKLMTEHGIDQQAIDLADIDTTEVKSKTSVSKVKDWELRLLNLVARAFGCKLIWSQSSSYAKDVYGHYIIVGLKSQVQLAAWTCVVLQKRLVTARTKFIGDLPDYLPRARKTIEGNGFAHGWVSAVSETVHSFALTDQQEKLLTDYVGRIATGGPSKIRQSRTGLHGHEAGMKAGSQERLHRPIDKLHSEQLGYGG